MCLGWGLRISISNKCPGDAGAIRGPTLRELYHTIHGTNPLTMYCLGRIKKTIFFLFFGLDEEALLKDSKSNTQNTQEYFV